jgi:hypothetical protein
MDVGAWVVDVGVGDVVGGDDGNEPALTERLHSPVAEIAM